MSVTLMSWVVIGVATRPAAGDPRPGPATRRSKAPGRRADQVDHLDVQRRMLGDGVAPATVVRVMQRAAARRLSARTMWRWLCAHGSAGLAAVVDAGLAEDSLLDHLDAGTAPDPHMLTVFAGLTRDTMPLSPPVPPPVYVDADHRPVDPGLAAELAEMEATTQLRRFDRLPPIAEPGFPPLWTGPGRPAVA